MNAGDILRTVTQTLDHVWCAEHGWHDAATHGEGES